MLKKVKLRLRKIIGFFQYRRRVKNMMGDYLETWSQGVKEKAPEVWHEHDMNIFNAVKSGKDYIQIIGRFGDARYRAFNASEVRPLKGIKAIRENMEGQIIDLKEMRKNMMNKGLDWRKYTAKELYNESSLMFDKRLKK